MIDTKASKTGLGRSAGGGTIMKKQPPFQIGKPNANQTSKFKVLIPFSLRIKEAGSEVAFGSSVGLTADGKIKFPGKK